MVSFNTLFNGHGFPPNMFGGNAANRDKCQINKKTLKFRGMCNAHDPLTLIALAKQPHASHPQQ